MTGRELILYILENGLENDQVIDCGTIIGFMTVHQVAVKMNVGTATVYAWIQQERLPCVQIGNRMFIPANFELKPV